MGWAGVNLSSPSFHIPSKAFSSITTSRTSPRPRRRTSRARRPPRPQISRQRSIRLSLSIWKTCATLATASLEVPPEVSLSHGSCIPSMSKPCFNLKLFPPPRGLTKCCMLATWFAIINEPTGGPSNRLLGLSFIARFLPHIFGSCWFRPSPNACWVFEFSIPLILVAIPACLMT